MEKVIYLKDIIKQAKKEYESCLKNVKEWKDWDYYRHYLWYLVYKRLSNEIWKNGGAVCVKYRNKVIRLPANLRWEYKEKILLDNFWYRITQIEEKIRDKYYSRLKKRLENI